MEEHELNYVIRDQNGDTVRPLDLLQAWGPPLRPPLRARVARLLIRIANWLYAPATPPHPPCFLTCSPQGQAGSGPTRGSLSV